MLSGRHVVMGVTGGIAAYKACEVVSRLKKLGAEVDVIMTHNATKLVAPLTFETLSARPVCVDTFARTESWDVRHISLAQKADVMLVAPATANLMAKLACGIADDMLTTTLLATKAPILLAPAMNTGMWIAEATQQNLRTLLARGVRTVGPDSGHLACGDSGAGRMSEPEAIVEAVCGLLCHRRDMEGLRVLVTAGPTQEALDPVRYLTNHSTGRMGYAIARAAAARGAEVTLVSGPTGLRKPVCVDTVDVVSAQDMFEAVTARAAGQDIIIKAAAVADYRPAVCAEDKLKKGGDDAAPSLPLARTRDILAWLGEHRAPGQFLCGFSMETRDLVENSRKKLEKKHLDLIAANNLRDPGAGFGTSTNLLTLIARDETVELPLLDKEEAAHALLDHILARRQRASVRDTPGT